MIEFLKVFWEVIQWMFIIPGLVIVIGSLMVMAAKYKDLVKENSFGAWIRAFCFLLIMFATLISIIILKVQ